jgi:hypothetical protein
MLFAVTGFSIVEAAGMMVDKLIAYHGFNDL